MTQDTISTIGGSGGDADIFAALWAAAPSLPRLPIDAPQEIRKLAIDVEDPERIYFLRRASRRHNFQLLVERYVLQLRFGCQSAYCNTPTCFTCRRRLAGSAPLRRYNATSARTLACFLAAQDNPERGLCPHCKAPSLKLPSPKRPGGPDKTVVTIRGSRDGHDQQQKVSSQQCQSRVHNSIGSSQHHLRSAGSASPIGRHSISATLKESIILEEVDSGRGRSAVQELREPVKKDHKSFIQNVFGTVAFKMVELLTPSSLETMLCSNHVKDFSATEGNTTLNKLDTSKSSSSAEIYSRSQEPVSPGSGDNTSVPNGELASTVAPFSRASSESSSPREGQVVETDLDNKSSKQQSARSGAQRSRRSRDFSDPLSQNLPSIKQLSGFPTHDTKDRGAIENGASKIGRFNNQAIVADEVDIQKTHSTENHMTAPHKKPQRRNISAIGSLGNLLDQEVLSYQGGHQHPSLRNIRRISTNRNSSSGVDIDTERKKVETAKDTKSDLLKPESPRLLNRNTSITFASPVPMSLSSFSIEIIDALSNIMEDINDLDFECLPIKSPYPRSGLQRTKRSTILENIDFNKLTTYKPKRHSRSQWKSFIEQSLFYVLSCPRTLLKSFSEEGLLFDTQTLWYSMIRLISMAPPLVFDALWVAAASLYTPPQHLWSKNNLAKDIRVECNRASTGYTTDQAAELMSVCLHALIAAVPYTSDDKELYEISRIRSHGLSSPSRPSSIKTSEMCLLHEDIFSNELALRLARRVFAAIPAVRQFQEAMAHNIPGCTTVSPPADILDAVLAPLDFLHIEVPSILDFPPDDRILHKKRVPILLIDWARTVMLQEWTGRPEVAADGCFGGALAMMSALYHKRKSLFLGDDIFWVDYLADSMDDMQMPIEWLSFTSDKKTVHLLDYPYLFCPSNLVTYFRAINYSRMSRSYEESTSKRSRVDSNLVYGSMLHDQRRREALLRRLPIATSKFLVLQIRRDHVLADAFNQLWRREERELSRPLKVRLGEDSGEEGFDSGGVQQEFFRLAIAEALNPDYGAFTIDDRTKMTWFQPGSPEPTWKFELIGLIISLAIYNGLTLPVTFPKCLYRKLLDNAVTELEHIEDGWPDLASGLSCLLQWSEADGNVSDVFSRTYEFSVESFGQHISRDMTNEINWPQFSENANRNPIDDNPANVRLVDGKNRKDYVGDYIQWLTDISVRPQYEAFQRGFYTCLERRSLALFDTDTLQSVVEGVQEIDISEMRKYTRYVGWGANHRTIKDFWSITKKYSAEEKKKLLEFVTASDRLPVGGMKNLQFVIQRHGVGDIDRHLPTSYTCFGTLLLPEYSTKEVLRDKLGMALENSKGFGFA